MEKNDVGDARTSGSVQPREGKVKQDVEGCHGNLELLDGHGEAGVFFVSTKGQGSRPQPNLVSASQAMRIILSPCQTLQQE